MNKAYKILYFGCFLLTLFVFISLMKVNNVCCLNILTIASFITFLLMITFMLKNDKVKILKTDIIFPITYIIFIIFMMVFGYIYNTNAIIKDIHFSYYYNLALIPFIGLNIYTFIIFKKNK